MEVFLMEKSKYKKLVNKYTPKENCIYNGIIAFIVGGLIGMLGQFLIEFYSYQLDIPSKQASVFMILTLVFLGCLLTALGIFDKMVEFAKCGLIIPITGFAHSMMSAALEYKREGLVTGIGTNMFKLAGSVIIFGVVAAYFFGIIRYFIGG
jgi:stage V sporulation protein AC